MKTPKLNSIECKPQIDPMHRDTSGTTLTRLYVDLQTGWYGITQEMDDNATPADELNGITRSTYTRQHYNEDAARSYLDDPDTVALVQRILAGGQVYWDGSNHKGGLNDDAQAAWDELISGLESLPESDWSVWTVDDWTYDWAAQIVTAEASNAEIERMAAELRSTAQSDHVILAGDLADYLYARREGALDSSLISLAHAARLTELDASHLRRLIRAGQIKASKPGHDWVIAAQDLRGLLRVKTGRPRKAANG